MSDLRRRLRALEAKHAADAEAPIIMFTDDDHERIEAAKLSGRMLVLLSDGDGFEVWQSGERLAGEIRLG